MKAQKEKQNTTSDLRETLKKMIQKELQTLPELLESLEPKERLNVLCKLMPYIMPKVESVHPTYGEPTDFSAWN